MLLESPNSAYNREEKNKSHDCIYQQIFLNFSKFSLKDLRAFLRNGSNKPYSVLHATKEKKGG